MTMQKSFQKLNKSIRRKWTWFKQDIENLFIKEDYSSKVFCIGYQKTGTTSVGKSFERLGLRNTSFNRRMWKFYQNNEIEKILKFTAKFDSTDDLPWFKEDMIPVLDKTFPNSKFVYMIREDEAWKKSYYNWRYKIFGRYPDLEKAFKGYKDHQHFVLEYFKDRPKDEFIILDITDPEGFKKLAHFIGKETDQDAFPHYNKT